MAGLRVAVDVTPLLGARTGVARTVEHLLEALPSVAPDVEVVPYVLSRAARNRTLPDGTIVLPFSAAIAIRRWGRGDRPWATTHLGHVDVVHGTNFVVPPVRGVPSTVTVHDTWCLQHPKECAQQVRPFRAALGRAIRRGAWAHVSTEAIAWQVRSIYETRRVAIVPFGVPPLGEPGPLPTALDGQRYLLSISTLEPRKRVEHLVRAFRSVAPWDDDIRLVIVGADGPSTTEVMREIKALPADIERRVLRFGHVDEPTRAALLRHATALVYPSADEGFGFPVLEAMSADVPVVATAVGGVPEVAGDAAVLVPVDDDARPLVEALRTVVTDGNVRSTLRRRGRARVATFSWTAHAEGMADMWRRVAAERVSS
ncbi:MAG TPA: glycosyltransferase family 1 protein [Acidimicrobiales bacterium]|nr:glycosyltransferase family 1 protein [Acidimicrobiales bacterium]